MHRRSGGRGAAAASQVIAVVLAVAVLLIGTASPAGPTTVAQADRVWWETTIVYQIYPLSFKDSNGDGVGDLPGITSKLDYLKELGVGAVWLSPIYPSPQKDFGYDISDFKDVDPQYGTLDDFKALLKRAHDLGLRVVLDYVPNHTSDEHEWFQKSVDGIPPYTDYYVWVDAKYAQNGTRLPPNNWLSSFRYTAWEWNEKRQKYYLHQFVKGQPDLNYRSPDVVREMKGVIKFWLDMGVDGIRIDTIPNLFEDDRFLDEPHDTDSTQTDRTENDYLKHIYTQNQKETYDMAVQWRALMDTYSGDRVMMTEAYATYDQTMGYYGTPEQPGASFSFNFFLIKNLNASSSAAEFKDVIDTWMSYMYPFRKPNWVIGNHDQHRVASFLRYGPELADGLNMIALLLPGTGVTYNGEEIGMEDTYITWAQTMDPQATSETPTTYLSRSRDLARTPFQWDDTTSAGFSSNTSTWLPVNPNYWRLNLKSQQEAEHSHYKIYRALVEARKKPAVQSQNFRATALGDVLVITRFLDEEDSFIVVVNLGSEAAVVPIANLGSSSLQVWTSSLNSNLRPRDTVTGSLNLRPKEGVVLTNGKVPPRSSSGKTASSLLSLLLATFVLLSLI